MLKAHSYSPKTLGYYNLRMIIYGKFLTPSEDLNIDMTSTVREFQQNCIHSAGEAIDLIYETFRDESFFQTWYGTSVHSE